MVFNPFKYKISELNQLEARAGLALVSEPFMDDPYFKRAVVYLAENNADGTVGFILNHSLDIMLSEVIETDIKDDFPLYLGGPVQSQNLFYIHSRPDLIPGSQLIDGSIHWAGDFEVLIHQINKGNVSKSEVRFFLGYSGWEENQLKEELKSNSWLVSPISNEFVLNPQTEDLWKEIISNSKKEISYMANFPADPSLN